jgi:hypothetical protein
MKNTKPYVAIATVCEKVLLEKDGVVSVIRVVDTFTVAELPAGALPNLALTAMIALKAGDLVGESRLSLIIAAPDGTRSPFPESWPVVFGGGETGANFVVTFGLPPNKPGLYWIEVLWNGESLTKIPIRLRQAQAAAPTGPRSVQ